MVGWVAENGHPIVTCGLGSEAEHAFAERSGVVGPTKADHRLELPKEAQMPSWNQELALVVFCKWQKKGVISLWVGVCGSVGFFEPPPVWGSILQHLRAGREAPSG